MNFNYEEIAASPKFVETNQDYIVKNDSLEQFDNHKLQRNMMAGGKSTVSMSHSPSPNNASMRAPLGDPQRVSYFDREQVATFRQTDPLYTALNQQRSMSHENTMTSKMSPYKQIPPRYEFRNTDLTSVRHDSSMNNE